jgi:hypothetical protein
MTPATQLLLDADAARQEGDRGKGMVIAAAVGIGHLFLCGIAEPSLSRTSVDFSWREAAAIELLLWFLLSALTFTGSTGPMLARIRLLPLTRTDRFHFTFRAMAERRRFLALMASGILFLVVHFRNDPAVAFAAAILYVSVAFASLSLFSIAFLLIHRTPAPMATSIIVLSTSGLLWIVGAGIAGTEGLLAALPLSGWWVEGLGAAMNHTMLKAAGYEALTLFAGAAACGFGRLRA